MNGKDKYRDFDGNGFDITQLQEWDQKHFMHPWAEMSSNKSKFDVITEGKGIYLYDSSGKKYIYIRDPVLMTNSNIFVKCSLLRFFIIGKSII